MFGGGLVSACSPGKDYFPPNFQGIFGVSDYLTMSTQRLLLWNQPLARELPRHMISEHFPTWGTVKPDDEAYQRDALQGFAAYRLQIDGLVNKPLSLSLAELKAMPSRTQVTQHSCEQGWSAIGEWTGVQLAHVLAMAGLKPTARCLNVRCIDGWWATMDLFDALHPQTILAYGMNGGELPMRHGAPVRLRVERHLGYLQLKFITHIDVIDDHRSVGDGTGAIWVGGDKIAWYAGI